MPVFILFVPANSYEQSPINLNVKVTLSDLGNQMRTTDAGIPTDYKRLKRESQELKIR